MNLFGGFTPTEIWSAVLTFALFNGFAVLEAVALGSFYVTSRVTRGGRVRTASLFHIVAAILFMLSVISTVWGAPAQKTFVAGAATDEHLFLARDAAGSLGLAPGLSRVLFGVAFAGIGIACMIAGFIGTGRQKRADRERALYGEPEPARGQRALGA